VSSMVECLAAPHRAVKAKNHLKCIAYIKQLCQ